MFSLLLQKTLESVFLPPYESLNLNHYTNYLMTSEDTVEDPLMSVQFYINFKSFFNSCYSFLMTSENIVEDPLMSVQFYIKSKSFFISFYSPSTVFILLQKTLESVFLPRYESLKLNHDTNFWMISEDTVEDPLMSVQFYVKSKSFFISCYSPSTIFHFYCKKYLNLFFYNALNL